MKKMHVDIDIDDDTGQQHEESGGHREGLRAMRMPDDVGLFSGQAQVDPDASDSDTSRLLLCIDSLMPPPAFDRLRLVDADHAFGSSSTRRVHQADRSLWSPLMMGPTVVPAAAVSPPAAPPAPKWIRLRFRGKTRASASRHAAEPLTGS